jgi:hypothetical protein
MALLTIKAFVPFHPLCIAAITPLLVSTKITGTQSAVKMPTAVFVLSVISASPS